MAKRDDLFDQKELWTAVAFQQQLMKELHFSDVDKHTGFGYKASKEPSYVGNQSISPNTKNSTTVGIGTKTRESAIHYAMEGGPNEVQATGRFQTSMPHMPRRFWVAPSGNREIDT